MNLEQSKYVLYFRLQDEPTNTAHCVLLKTIVEAANHLTQFQEQELVWANLLNDSGIVVRELNSLI